MVFGRAWLPASFRASTAPFETVFALVVVLFAAAVADAAVAEYVSCTGWRWSCLFQSWLVLEHANILTGWLY
jgi:hypothetical protein